MEETTSPTRDHRRLAGSLVAALVGAVAAAPASAGSPAWLLIAVLVGVIAHELLGPAYAPRIAPEASVPTVTEIDLGSGLLLVGAPTIAPICLDALRGWAWLSERWEPTYRPKRGGKKAGKGAEILRPDNKHGTVNRLVSDWRSANGNRWSHDELVKEMVALGLLYRMGDPMSGPLNVAPFEAASHRLLHTAAATLRRY